MSSDAYNVYETAEMVSAIGVRKSKQRIDHRIIQSMLAGILLSFGGLFLLTVGGGSAPLAQSLGSGIHKAIQAAVFPIGIILIVITGADLFTGNTMILIVSTFHRRTSLLQALASWIISFFGNLGGCLFFQCILVYYAGLLSNEPYRSFTINLAEQKGSLAWHELFLRGIGGNWLVCLSLWLGTSARELHSKVIGIYLPIWLFIAVGYEDSIVNMFTVQMGMILGANLSVARYVIHVLLPVTLGNIIGGGFFVGFMYWYLFSTKNSEMGAQRGSYHIARQKEPTDQSQQV